MPRVRHASRYSPGTLEKARKLGVAPHELAGWPDRFPADEQGLAQRRPRSLVPEGVRLLACALIEQAISDLEREPLERARVKYLAADYRPDYDGARRWLHETGDEACSVTWCEQVTGLCLDKLRTRYPRRQEGPVEAPRRPVERRGRKPRPIPPPVQLATRLRDIGR